MLGILYGVIDLDGFTTTHLDTIKVGEIRYVYMMTQNSMILAYFPDAKQIMKLDMSEFDFGKKYCKQKTG